MKIIKFMLFILICLNLYGNNLINQLDCDVVKKFPTYTSCYNYEVNGPLLVTYTLHGDTVNAVNIRNRPAWKIIDELNTPNRDKINNLGYQVGHLAPDAAFDYDKEVLKSVYVLGYNTVPMYPHFNMYVWSKLERHARNLAKLHNSVVVTNIVIYNKNNSLVGLTKVSNYIYKILKYDNTTECYLGHNEFTLMHIPIDINDMRVDCSTIVFGTTYTINKIDWR